MKLSNLEFIKLLPEFMRDDSAVKGLASAMDKIIPGLAKSFDNLSTWDHIDDLSAAELDALAWELNILWYNSSAPIEVKRDLIKSSDKVHKTLGTKAAVESVIGSYFGDGYVSEWFEYGGEPGHFMVISSNPSVSNERLSEFLATLNKVKRASAKLDSVTLLSEGRAVLTMTAGFHDAGTDTFPAVSFL